MLNQDEVIQHLCGTVAIAYHSIQDFRWPSDGFCSKCPAQEEREPGYKWHFQHTGWTLDFVRQAVIEKLQRDGLFREEALPAITPITMSWPLPPKEEIE